MNPDMAQTTRYLRFVRVRSREVGKTTQVWEVRSVMHEGLLLGTISWYGRWRQYTFFPAEDTIFNRTCMSEIATFIEGLMADRK